MPHRLENKEEMQGVIDRILVILETSIPVASRPPLDTLPAYSDNNDTSSSINPHPSAEISTSLPTAVTDMPEASTSTPAINNDTPAIIPSSTIDLLLNVESISKPTATQDDGTHDLSLPHLLSGSSPSPQIYKEEEEEEEEEPPTQLNKPPELQSPEYSPSPSLFIAGTPPSSFSQPTLSSSHQGETTTLPSSPLTPRDDHLFNTRVLVISAALAIGIAIVWAVLRSRQ